MRISVVERGGALVRIEHSVGESVSGIAPGPDDGLRERLCQIVFENLPSGRVFVLDRDGRIVAAGGARSLTGIPVHGLVGLRARDLLDPAEYARFEPALRAAMDGSAVHREGQVRGVDLEYWMQPAPRRRGRRGARRGHRAQRHRAEAGGARIAGGAGTSRPGARRKLRRLRGVRPRDRRVRRSAGAGTRSWGEPRSCRRSSSTSGSRSSTPRTMPRSFPRRPRSWRGGRSGWTWSTGSGGPTVPGHGSGPARRSSTVIRRASPGG